MFTHFQSAEMERTIKSFDMVLDGVDMVDASITCDQICQSSKLSEILVYVSRREK